MTAFGDRQGDTGISRTKITVQALVRKKVAVEAVTHTGQPNSFYCERFVDGQALAAQTNEISCSGCPQECPLVPWKPAGRQWASRSRKALCSPSRNEESGQAGGYVLTCSVTEKRVEYSAIPLACSPLSVIVTMQEAQRFRSLEGSRLARVAQKGNVVHEWRRDVCLQRGRWNNYRKGRNG